MSGFAVLVGFLYGWHLMLVAGHCSRLERGSFIPAALGSAPLGFAGLWVALVGTPLFWSGMGFLSMKLADSRFRRTLYVVLACHVLGAAALLGLTGYGDWSSVAHNTELQIYFVWWAFLYALGHSFVMRKLIRFYATKRETG